MMMIELRYIYILIHVLYISVAAAAVVATLEASNGARDVISDDGERFELHRLAVSQPNNKYQMLRKRSSINRQDFIEELEQPNESVSHYKRKPASHSHTTANHRARFNADRFRRLVSELPLAANQLQSEISKSATQPIHHQQALQTSFACEQYSTLWNQLRDAYPSLTAYLFALSEHNALNLAQKVDWQLAANRNGIVRHLEEADRLASEQHATNFNGSQLGAQSISSHLAAANTDTSFTSTYSPDHDSRASKQSSWLSRVVTNPFYAKLIQYLQQSKQQQQVGKLEESISEPPANGPTRQELAPESHVYGKLAHYPHELQANSGSIKMSKTLDKLRQLNLRNHDRQPQPNLGDGQADQNQSMANEIDRLASRTNQVDGTSLDQDVESNRIQITGGDGRPWRDGRHPSSADSSAETDSIRNKFVYGSVLLRPNQRVGEIPNPHAPGHTLGTLRHLSAELESAGQNSNNQEVNFQTDGVPSSARAQVKGEQIKIGRPMAGESYGRILVNPSSLSDSSSSSNHRMDTGSHGQEQLAKEAQLSDEQQISSGSLARWLDNKTQLTLGKQRQQLEQSNQFEQIQPDSLEAAGRYSEDDHSRGQLLIGSSSSSATGPNHALLSGATGETGNEFEGTWHAGPLQQIEVRQTRLHERPANEHRGSTQTEPGLREVFLVD